ncbi:MAG: TonB-dependent siderophore receptor [Azoarcus sp.]|jgi:outer membrane receptor for ferric coprogen and ferric-rhodotorulic acid|nr:TonB-dependent siderophore receptor [Azoarcus sp.]
MKTRQQKLRSWAAILASAGIVSSALAQTQAEDTRTQTEETPTQAQTPVVLDTVEVSDDRYLSEVSVGGKEPVKLREVPQSVTVITKERIEDQGLVTVNDALKQVTGVTVLSNNTNESQFRSRGYGLNMTFDGSPSFSSLSAFPQLDLAIYERVEVLRGPAGLFQGTGDFGGVVNLVRKRGQKEFTASGSLSAGSWNNYNTVADVGGPLKADGSVRARAVISATDREYFYDTTASKNYLGYATLDWDITPATTLSLAFSSQDTKTKAPSVGLPAWGAPIYGLLDVSRSTNLIPRWSYSNWTTQDTNAEFTHRFVNDWSANVKFFHREQNSHAHTGRQNSSLNTAGTLNYTRYDSDGTYERDAIDFYVAGPFRLFGQEHKILLGYNSDRYLNHNESGYPVPNSIANVPFGRPDLVPDFSVANSFPSGNETEYRQSGFYGRLQLRLLDPLTVIVGGRVSDYRSRTRRVPPGTPTSWTTSAKVNDEVTPYGGLVFDLNRQISLYASYSDLFVPQTLEKFDGGALEPNVGKQYEIGSKGEFFGGKLIASLAYFDIRNEKLAFEDPDHPGYYLNAGKVESKGWEVEVSGSPVPGWNLSAGYTHLKTKTLKDSDTRNVGKDINYLNNSDPEHLFKFWATYKFEKGTLNGLTVGLGATHQSEIHSTNAWGDPPRRTQDSYTLANAFLSYAFDKRLSLSLNINNLFDKVYYTRIGNNRSAATGNFYGEPRNYLLTLRASY